MNKTNIKNKSDYEMYLLLFNNLYIPFKYITLDLINNLFEYNQEQLCYLNERLIEEGYSL